MILYFINHFALKKLQPLNSESEGRALEYLIYSESDVTDDLRQKIVLNVILTNELVEDLVLLLKSPVLLLNKVTKIKILILL